MNGVPGDYKSIMHKIDCSLTCGGLAGHDGPDLLFVFDVVFGRLDCLHAIAVVKDGPSHYNK